MFPTGVSGLDQAEAYLWTWIVSLGGDVAPSGAVLFDRRPEVLLVGPFEVTDDESLIWRHDRHGGHEAADGGPTHLHVGTSRVAHEPVTLDTIRELIVIENLRRR